MDALVEDPNAAEQVAALDAFELHELLREVGLSDAVALARLATPEQVQRFIDFDAWHREEFSTRAFEEWLEVYLGLPDEAFARLVLGLDPEVLPLFLKLHVRVYMADDEGRPPEDVEEQLEVTPDQTYYVHYPEDARSARLCRELVRRVYDTLGVMKGWMLLEATRWELESEMGTAALHFRTQRLQEHGFDGRLEALEKLAPVSLELLRAEAEVALASEALRVGAGVPAMPRGFANALATLEGSPEDFLRRCIEGLDAARADLIQSQLVALGNLTASARGVEPGDRAGARRVFEQTLGRLNVSLEFLARDDVARGSRLLERMPLRRIYLTGDALIRRLSEQAAALLSRGRLTLTDSPTSLLNEGERALMDGLTRQPAVRDGLSGAIFPSLWARRRGRASAGGGRL